MSRGARLLLRGAAGLALLALAIRYALPPETRSLATFAGAWTSPPLAALGFFAAACICFGANFGVGALRFVALLRGSGVAVGFAPVLRAYLVAGFVSAVLPAGLGDVYRFADARRDTGRGGEVLGIVVLERLLGLAALGAIALVAVPFLPLAPEEQVRGLLVAAAAAFVLAPLCPLHPAGRALLRRLLPVVAAVSGRLSRAAERALAAIDTVSQRPVVVVQAFGASLLMQFLPVVAVGILSLSLDSPVPSVWFAVIVPAVTLIAIIPVSLAGVGVREYLYIAFFGAVGMRPEVALALSLSTFAVTLFWGLIGLSIFAARSAGARPGQEPRPT